jgi:hypothetical protein
VTERERDLERFLTFVDAIVAIAITLLVLPLVEVGAEIGEGSVPELLAVLAWVIGHDRTLRDDEARPDSLSAAATTVAFLLALVISVAFPAASYWPLLVLVLADPVVDRIRRRTRVGI